MSNNFSFSVQSLITSVIVIILAIILWTFLKKVRDSILHKVNDGSGNLVRKTSSINRLFNIVKFLITYIALIIILDLFGVNVSSLIASLGIAGVVAGMAWQDVFKDSIQGLRIMSEQMFVAGDYISYNGTNYQVIEFSIRTTKLRDYLTNNIVYVSNRNITEVTKLSGTFLLTINLSYNDSPEDVDNALSLACSDISKLEDVIECTYLGIQAFGDFSIEYLIRFQTAPNLCLSKKREALKIIHQKLHAYNLEIPYPQLDVHQK